MFSKKQIQGTCPRYDFKVKMVVYIWFIYGNKPCPSKLHYDELHYYIIFSIPDTVMGDTSVSMSYLELMY